MNETSGTTGNKTPQATVTIFSPPQGVCPRVMESIALMPGTKNCPRIKMSWETGIGGVCAVLATKMNVSIILSLRIRRQQRGPFVLQRHEFLLDELEGDGRKTNGIIATGRTIFIEVPPQFETKEPPPQFIRGIGNAIIGILINQHLEPLLASLENSMRVFSESPPRRRQTYRNDAGRNGLQRRFTAACRER